MQILSTINTCSRKYFPHTKIIYFFLSREVTKVFNKRLSLRRKLSVLKIPVYFVHLATSVYPRLYSEVVPVGIIYRDFQNKEFPNRLSLCPRLRKIIKNFSNFFRQKEVYDFSVRKYNLQGIYLQQSCHSYYYNSFKT